MSAPEILARGFAPNYCMSGQHNFHSVTSLVLVNVSMCLLMFMYLHPHPWHEMLF